MNINILKRYVEQCRANNITPDWEGLKRFNNTLKGFIYE